MQPREGGGLRGRAGVPVTSRPAIGRSGLISDPAVFISHRSAWYMRHVGVDFGRIALQAGRDGDAEAHDAAMALAVAASLFEATCARETALGGSAPEGSSSEHDDLSRAEAAELLGVSPQAVGSMIARGALPAGRIGRTLVIARSDVEALARERLGAA